MVIRLQKKNETIKTEADIHFSVAGIITLHRS